MLIEFSVGNYLSFKEKVTFSMVAADLSSQNTITDKNNNNIFAIDSELKLLKSAAIYGANASGKSNLANALNFMRQFVLNSSRETQVTDTIDVDNFRLSTETETQPSFFEIVFIIQKKIYRYGFEADINQVFSEWLYHVPKNKEYCLFERKDNLFKIRKKFREGDRLDTITRKNALFLSVVAQFNGKIAQVILSWFSKMNIISGVQDSLFRHITHQYMQNIENKSEVIKFIQELDLSIIDIRLKESSLETESIPNVLLEDLRWLFGKVDSQITIETIHHKYNNKGEVISREVFDLDRNESEGTKKVFAFSTPILQTLKYGRVLVMDELEARLHPLITRAIVELFNSPETNPKNAQLVFMTHDASLINGKLFRPDQIWFMEKSQQEYTVLYSLAEYKLKPDADLKENYIKGRYGAIPFIGNLKSFISSLDG